MLVQHGRQVPACGGQTPESRCAVPVHVQDVRLAPVELGQQRGEGPGVELRAREIRDVYAVGLQAFLRRIGCTQADEAHVESLGVEARDHPREQSHLYHTGALVSVPESEHASRVEGRRVTSRESVALPALSHRAAVRVPWARFLPPLSEPGVPISGTLCCRTHKVPYVAISIMWRTRRNLPSELETAAKFAT